MALGLFVGDRPESSRCVASLSLLQSLTKVICDIDILTEWKELIFLFK